MWRVTLLGLVPGLVGCGSVMRLPSLDYPHEARLEVRFDGQPMQLDVIRARDPAQAVVASCHDRCSLTLPSGRYRVVAHGHAPSQERAIDLDGTTRVVVKPGNSAGRYLGIGATAAGAGASMALLIPLVAPPCDRIDGSCGQRPLLIIGLVGLGALAGGLVLMGTTGTELDVTTDDAPPSSPTPLANGNGVGVAF